MALLSDFRKNRIPRASRLGMEPKAEAAMQDLAKRTGGLFTIIEAGGKIRQVPAG